MQLQGISRTSPRAQLLKPRTGKALLHIVSKPCELIRIKLAHIVSRNGCGVITHEGIRLETILRFILLCLNREHGECIWYSA